MTKLYDGLMPTIDWGKGEKDNDIWNYYHYRCYHDNLLGSSPIRNEERIVVYAMMYLTLEGLFAPD